MTHISSHLSNGMSWASCSNYSAASAGLKSGNDQIHPISFALSKAKVSLVKASMLLILPETVWRPLLAPEAVLCRTGNWICYRLSALG